MTTETWPKIFYAPRVKETGEWCRWVPMLWKFAAMPNDGHPEIWPEAASNYRETIDLRPIEWVALRVEMVGVR